MVRIHSPRPISFGIIGLRRLKLSGFRTPFRSCARFCAYPEHLARVRDKLDCDRLSFCGRRCNRPRLAPEEGNILLQVDKIILSLSPAVRRGLDCQICSLTC